MNEFIPFMKIVAILTALTFVAWLLLFKLKNSALKIFLAAIMGALLGQVQNRLSLGYKDPFTVIAFFVSLPITGAVAAILELLLTRIRRRKNQDD